VGNRWETTRFRPSQSRQIFPAIPEQYEVASSIFSKSVQARIRHLAGCENNFFCQYFVV